MEMKRYLDEPYLNRFLQDFKFLFDSILKSNGEIDLRLRHNYFNLYYKGNSLAKVSFKNDNNYEISIHKKFTNNKTCTNNKIFYKNIFALYNRFKKPEIKSGYESYILDNKTIHPFLQEKYLKQLCSNVKKRNYGEEIVFEQMLITDNMDRSDIIIIDRQITETSLKRKRLDLLGLLQKEGNKYYFQVIEVKLGNNKELKKDVAEQLNDYIKHIENYFPDWKKSYENTYIQLKKAGLIKKPEYKEIIIENDVSGLIVVGGYSQMANKSIRELESHYKEIKIKHFKYELTPSTVKCPKCHAEFVSASALQEIPK